MIEPLSDRQWTLTEVKDYCTKGQRMGDMTFKEVEECANNLMCLVRFPNIERQHILIVYQLIVVGMQGATKISEVSARSAWISLRNLRGGALV